MPNNNNNNNRKTAATHAGASKRLQPCDRVYGDGNCDYGESCRFAKDKCDVPNCKEPHVTKPVKQPAAPPPATKVQAKQPTAPAAKGPAKQPAPPATKVQAKQPPAPAAKGAKQPAAESAPSHSHAAKKKPAELTVAVSGGSTMQALTAISAPPTNSVWCSNAVQSAAGNHNDLRRVADAAGDRVLGAVSTRSELGTTEKPRGSMNEKAAPPRNAGRCAAPPSPQSAAKGGARCEDWLRSSDIQQRIPNNSPLKKLVDALIEFKEDYITLAMHPCEHDKYFGAGGCGFHGTRCMYRYFPRELCLAWLKDVMEGRNPHATRCGKNRRLECSNVHTFEELRARHNGRHQHQHLRASAATTIASDTLEPAFKLNPEKSFADMARSTATKTTDAATALPTSGLPQHPVSFTAPTSPATPLQRSVSKKQRPSKDDAAAASTSDSDALGLSTSITRGYDLAKYVSFASEKNFPTADDLCNYDDDEVIKSNLPDLLVRDPNIPPTKEQQNAHLDALYRNRREEFVGPLRLAVHLVWEEWDRVELSTAKQRRFVWENVKARSDELRADVRYYEHVTYQQCAATDAGITLTLEVDVHLDRRRRWNKSFTNGNLLLLSFSQFHYNDVAFDPEGTSLGIICVIVVSTSTKAVKMANGRVVKDFDGGVGVTPVTGTDSKLLARLLSDASLCGQSVWILESTNFYLPYDRTLSCLQATARSQEGPMFDGALLSQASLESSARPPQYLENRTLKLSTAIAASHPNLTFTPTQGAKLPQDALPKWSFELEESIADEWSHRHVLDDTQRDAIVHMLTSKLAIVQGPPGTGKSFVGEKFLQILFENRHQLPKLRPILLLCETNHALDSVLLGLQRYMGEDVFNESVARFGTRTSDPSLENVLVSRIAQGRGKAHVLNTRSTAAAITAIHSLMTSLSDFTWKGDTDKCIRALRWMESSKCFRPLATTSEFDESVVEQLCKQLAAAEAKLHSFVEQQNQRAQEILLDMTQHLDEAAATDSQASDLMIALGIDRKNKADIESAINWIRENSVEDFLRKDLQVLSDVERDCIAYEGLLSGVGSIPKHSENDPGSVGHVVDHLLHWVHEKKKLHPNDLHLDMFCDDLKAHATNLAQLRSEHAYFERASDNIAILETELLGTISTNLSTAKSDVARVKRLMSKSELYLAVQLDDELAETKFAQDTIIPEDTEDGAVSEEDEDTMARRLENQANRDTGDFDAQVVANQVANVAQLSSCVGWTETNPYSALRELASRCLNTVTQEYLSHVSDAKTQDILGLVDLLRDRFLIAGTTTTATRDLAVLRYLQTNVVVVEEAAEVREEGVWACLTEHTEHLILIGDHMQLRPKIATSFIRTAERHGTAVSMMERLVTTLQAPHKTITTQRRMHPALAQLVAPYYKANVGINIVSHPSTVQRPNMSLLPSQPDPSRIAWIPVVNGVEMQTNAGSWMNAAEANAAIRLTMLLRHVYDCGDVFTHHGSSITILTFYSGQRQELESAAKRYNVWFGPKERDLRIKTVDDFQGEESDVIILSTVRTTDERHMLKFIEAENRWCVALSRARSQVYIICSQNLFCAPLQPGRNTLQNRAAGSVHIMKTLYANLIASRPHPDYERLNANAVVAQVCTDSSHATQLSWLQGSTAASFLRCGETCGKRLPCGHACSMKCHDDRSCDARQCNVTKIVRLECGHDQPTHCGSVKLPRCTTALPDFKCKDCGHSPKQNVLCHQLTSKSYKCKQQCNKKLGCTHRCAMKCHEPCQCTTTVSKALPCGHTQQVLCTVPPSELSTVHCRAVCGGKIGSCGHGCSGECGACAQLGDGFHVPCNATIKVWTPDGEQRDATCSDPMKPVCNVTDPNLESIAKLCDTRDHEVFTLNAPCDKKLPCGCQCLGLLGELCPEFCIDHVPSDTNTLPKFMNDCTVNAAVHQLTDITLEVVRSQASSSRLVQTPCCRTITFAGDMKNYLDTFYQHDATVAMVCAHCERAVTHREGSTTTYPLCAGSYLPRLQLLRGIACYVLNNAVHVKSEYQKEIDRCVDEVTKQMLDAEPTDFIKRATLTRNEKKEAERVRKLTGEPTQPELPNEEKLRIAHKKQRRDCYAAVRLRFIEQDDLTSDSRCLNVTTLLYTALWACRFQRKEPTEALVKLTTLLSSAVDECGAILLISVLPDAQLIPLREYICDILEPHLSDSSGGDDSNELLSFRSAGDPLKEAAIDCLLNGVFALIAAAQLEASCAKRRSRNDRMNDNRKPAHTVRVHAPPNDKFVQQIEEMVHGMLGANRDAFVRNPCFCATACSAWQRFITGAMHVCGLNAGETMDDDSERWLLQNTQVVFHGTKSNDAIQRISCRGFDLGRRGKTHGQVHGVGEYFGRTIEMSDAYSGQTEVMLVCLALKETNALCPLPDRPLGFTPTIFVPSNEKGREMLVVDNKLEETFVAPIGILYHKALNRVARDTGVFDCDYPLGDLRAVEQIQDLSAQFADHLKTAVACQDLQRLRQFRRTIVLRFRLAVQKAASSAFPTGLPAMSFTHSSIWTSLSELNVEYRFCASTSAVADPSEVEQLQWFLCTATHNNEMGDEGPPSQQRVVLYNSKDSRCPMCAAAAEVKN